MKEAFARLKSGSDIRGVAVSEGNTVATLTDEIGRAAGRAFALWLAKRRSKACDALTVAVGRDSRVTGEALQAAMLAGLSAEGVRTLDCGLCTTPAMFMSTLLLNTDGAVMVTASHLPWQRNGYKFFTPDGGLDGTDITALLEMASEMDEKAPLCSAEKADLLAVYSHFLRKIVRDALGEDKPLDGLQVAVDAGNGAGGFYAQVLASLGANTEGSQFLEPDGRFPNHIPNPEAPEAMESLGKAVRASGADLGVLFDADCDRAALVDSSGREINRNRLIALVATMLLRERQDITIVTDSVVSAGLDDFLKRQGGVLHRFKRGYRNVIDEAIRLNQLGIDCPLAMETSGHAALRENHFLDDGMYLVTRLIIEAQRLRRQGLALESLIEGLEEPLESAEIRLPILEEDFRIAGQVVVDAVIDAAQADAGQRIDPENREGVRIQFGSPSNWALLRLSVHDPLLVINAESDHTGGVAHMVQTLAGTLRRHPGIDSTALKA